MRKGNGYRIIVVKGDDETFYLDANDPLTWAASSLKLLTERYKQNWYASPDEIFGRANELPYTSAQLEALRTLPENDPARKAAAQQVACYKRENKQRLEHAEWWNEMFRIVTDQDLSFVTPREGLDEERALRYSRPLAWQLLYERADHEYESVRLETVLSPFTNE